jgi:hypothetical protein
MNNFDHDHEHHHHYHRDESDYGRAYGYWRTDHDLRRAFTAAVTLLLLPMYLIGYIFSIFRDADKDIKNQNIFK